MDEMLRWPFETAGDYREEASWMLYGNGNRPTAPVQIVNIHGGNSVILTGNTQHNTQRRLEA